MELLCLKVFASYLEGQTRKVFCSDLWLLAYNVFICRRQRLCGFGGKDLLFTACLRHLEEKTTKVRLTSCPPLTSSIANTKCVRCQDPQEISCSVFLLRSWPLFAEGLRQHRQDLSSHLQDSFVKDILITNYLDMQLSGAGIYPVPVSAMPEKKRSSHSNQPPWNLKHRCDCSTWVQRIAPYGGRLLHFTKRWKKGIVRFWEMT